MSPQEAKVIRSQLRIRYNAVRGYWQVYTTLKGSGIFKWFVVSPEAAEQYKKDFPEIIVDPDVIDVFDPETGKNLGAF